MPLTADSMKSATYVSVHVMQGLANVRPHDAFGGGSLSIHRAHNFGSFQGFYAANATIGGYNVSDGYRQGENPNQYYKGGGRFFGGVGASAGINGVLPLGDAEWRYLGAEMSWQQEYGEYYKFRKSLPDAAVSYIDRHNHYITWGFNTEMLGRISKTLVGGYKAGYYTSINKLYRTDGANTLRPGWFSQTLHLGTPRHTFHVQMNAGTKMLGFNIGASFMVGR
ncbi:hypothetical protein HHL16_16825 [Pseudoflavitalea sp. G-6-1-2]|uniref:hypothetical protein n=1 Tax=Pseudoflavitalea sp. G-6-1-2 TaxID=2728841 RepID=UPI00146CA69C|nr:hypothetical protein [Pseudoflavitalea sp. G-6-1-2]NML22548.1 hypothetical protein [Pseudoflavitalea sp. G-6-1-2]